MPHPFKASTARWLHRCALLLAGCSWQPVARPVQPERVFEGAARVEGLLGREGRHALVEVTAPAPAHYRVIDAQDLTYCSLPPEHRPAHGSLVAPSLRGEGVPRLLIPLRLGTGVAAQLYFADETCTLKGPFGKLGTLQTLTLRADAREVLLSVIGGELSLIDPWTDTTRVIARDVGGYQIVEPDNNLPVAQRPPEALWILEGSKLVQRGLDGTLLLSLGQDVQEFEQHRFEDGLRVTFRDGADLFEAKGPEFTPKLIAEGACDAFYRPTSLDLHFPCDAEQLVRVELLTGSVRRFSPGVFESYSVGEFEVELARDAAGAIELYVSTKRGPRARVQPLPEGAVSPVGSTLMSGRTSDGRFGVWNIRGEFTEVLRGVRDVRAFRGARTNDLEWLILHDVQDSLGRISTFVQRDVERVLADPTAPLLPRLLAEGVPISNGFRIAGGIGSEPVVLTLEQAKQQTDKRFAGTLHARLLSGSLEARIDEGVSSNLLVISPQPAVLYGISEGARSGLWFAAL